MIWPTSAQLFDPPNQGHTGRVRHPLTASNARFGRAPVTAFDVGGLQLAEAGGQYVKRGEGASAQLVRRLPGLARPGGSPG